MTYDDFHPALRAAIGCHEGFRKLGFVSDDIYLEFARDAGAPFNPLTLFVELRSQGKTFNVSVARVSEEEATLIESQWLALCAAVNDGSLPQADLDRIWQESLPHNNAIGFITAILSKGFVIPNHKGLS